MTAIPTSLHIEQGATFAFGFTLSDGVETAGEWAPGPPRNLTGFTARMQIRKKQAATMQLAATTENGAIHLDSAGHVAVVLSATMTDALQTKSSQFDLELVSSTGVVERLLEGPVVVDPNTTQTAPGTDAERKLTR